MGKGADRSILTDEGERPLDLVDPSDFATIRIMLTNTQNTDDTHSSEDDLDEPNGHLWQDSKNVQTQ